MSYTCADDAQEGVPLCIGGVPRCCCTFNFYNNFFFFFFALQRVDSSIYTHTHNVTATAALRNANVVNYCISSLIILFSVHCLLLLLLFACVTTTRFYCRAIYIYLIVRRLALEICCFYFFFSSFLRRIRALASTKTVTRIPIVYVYISYVKKYIRIIFYGQCSNTPLRHNNSHTK